MTALTVRVSMNVSELFVGSVLVFVFGVLVGMAALTVWRQR